MDTQWFKIESEADSAQIGAAAKIIKRGGLLAIPTETVYGLGADGLNEEAVLHIFEAKGRPQDNPLILHIPSADWLSRYCEDVPEAAYKLAERFWPGPLTMILKKKPIVPLRTTGGLETVGMRCPDHGVTRAIIAAADVPIAAPSANTSGRPSCTSAEDVREDMWGKIDGIVDGGVCEVGVESTIIDLTVTPPQLLRPGGLPLEALREVLGEVSVDKAVTGLLSEGEKPRAPGMKYRHYAPHSPVTVVSGDAKASARYLLTHAKAGDGVIAFSEFVSLFPEMQVHDLGASGDKKTQAQRVFDALRSFDSTDVPRIWAQCPDSKGLGLAISNRLQKAAGFHCIDAGDDTLVVGITGGTGAGKTTVLESIEQKGALILDCDAVYHEMLRSDEKLKSDIASVFGDVFTQEGALDRQKLGTMVFGNPEKLQKLDEIVHANLPRELAHRISESEAKTIALDAIKLIESGLGALCDTTIAVTAPEEARVKRIMKRDNISEEYARSRIRAQKDEAWFAAHCDHVIHNNFATGELAKDNIRKRLNIIFMQLKEERNHGKEEK